MHLPVQVQHRPATLHQLTAHLSTSDVSPSSVIPKPAAQTLAPALGSGTASCRVAACPSAGPSGRRTGVTVQGLASAMRPTSLEGLELNLSASP